MDTIAKKGRFYLLAAAILSYLGAVGTVVDQIVNVLITRFVTENVGTVLGMYGQFSAAAGAVFTGAAPCILLLLAAMQTAGRSKKGLFLLACGEGFGVAMLCLMLSAGAAELMYQIGMLSAGGAGLLYFIGDLFLVSDRQNCGTIKGIAAASAVFALLTAATKIGANVCGYLYLLTYENDPWITWLQWASSANLFATIIGSVLNGSKLMLLFALPTVNTEPPETQESESLPETDENN